MNKPKTRPQAAIPNRAYAPGNDTWYEYKSGQLKCKDEASQLAWEQYAKENESFWDWRSNIIYSVPDYAVTLVNECRDLVFNVDELDLTMRKLIVELGYPNIFCTPNRTTETEWTSYCYREALGVLAQVWTPAVPDSVPLSSLLFQTPRKIRDWSRVYR